MVVTSKIYLQNPVPTKPILATGYQQAAIVSPVGLLMFFLQKSNRR